MGKREPLKEYVLPEGTKPGDYVTPETPYGLCSKCQKKARHRPNHYYCKDCSNAYQRKRYAAIESNAMVIGNPDVELVLKEAVKIAYLCGCDCDHSVELKKMMGQLLGLVGKTAAKARGLVGMYEGTEVSVQQLVTSLKHYAHIGDRSNYDHYLDIANKVFPRFKDWPEYDGYWERVSEQNATG